MELYVNDDSFSNNRLRLLVYSLFVSSSRASKNSCRPAKIVFVLGEMVQRGEKVKNLTVDFFRVEWRQEYLIESSRRYVLIRL